MDKKDEQDVRAALTVIEGSLKSKDERRKEAFIRIGMGVVMGALVVGLLWLGQTYVFSNTNAHAQELYNQQVQTQLATHTHDWTNVYKNVHKEAETHTVEHPATYAQMTTYETVCDTCNMVISGQADSHIQATGHAGYTTNVPITGTVMSAQGWTETVVDVPATDEQVLEAQVCAGCGLSRAAA